MNDTLISEVSDERRDEIIENPGSATLDEIRSLAAVAAMIEDSNHRLTVALVDGCKHIRIAKRDLSKHLNAAMNVILGMPETIKEQGKKKRAKA